MLEKWLLRLNIEEPTVHKKICWRHFRPGDFEKGQRLRLKKNVVPFLSNQPLNHKMWFGLIVEEECTDVTRLSWHRVLS